MNECSHERVFYWTVGDDLCGGCCDCGWPVVGAVDTKGEPMTRYVRMNW
jgi:hypothetical protein